MQIQLFFVIFLCILHCICLGQIQPPSAPQFEQFTPIQLNGNIYKNTPSPNISYQNRPKMGATADDIIKQQNEQLKQLIYPTPSAKERQLQSLEIVQALLKEQEQKKHIGKPLASQAQELSYLNAAKLICAMLLGKEKVSIKKAVWLAENPYLREQYNYQAYLDQIADIVSFCELYAKEQKIDWTKHDNRVRILVDCFSKTLTLKNGKTHKPFKYDFNDPYGSQSYQSLMVSKLLKTNKGQCHSMPLLFKVIAEEINIKAFICLSPAHSYIKLFLEEGRTPVFETTNGYLTEENWLLSTNIVPFTALRNGVYLDTLSAKETLVHCLTHLANAYESEFGYQKLVYDIAELSVQETPKYPPAWALFSNYVTFTTMEALAKLNYPKLDELDSYPILKNRLELMYQIYADMDKMGYKDLKEMEYLNWLENNQETIKKYQLQDF